MIAARRGWSAAQAAHWKAFGRREKTAVRPGDAEPHACAPRGCTDSSGSSVARPVHGSWPARRWLVCVDASDAGCAVRVQRLEPFIALMLIRQRLPLIDATDGAQHSALGAAAMALPLGLLTMVCAAMLKLESKLDVRAG